MWWQARIALRFPWWTLSGSFQDTASLAQFPGNATAVQQALEMQVSGPLDELLDLLCVNHTTPG